jgi:hypothetical protein
MEDNEMKERKIANKEIYVNQTLLIKIRLKSWHSQINKTIF